jgi:AhpD family alkylhydroperoxidase
MEARMTQPVVLLPAAMKALQAFGGVAEKSDVPAKTLGLVHLRASQINGCSFCVDMHSRELREAGEPDERIWGVASWRESPYFDDAERAALTLAEAGTRLSDREDPVPDEVWEEAARHYDEAELTSLVLLIAAINAWNRLNVLTRQPAGSWR